MNPLEKLEEIERVLEFARTVSPGSPRYSRALALVRELREAATNGWVSERHWQGFRVFWDDHDSDPLSPAILITGDAET